MKLACRSQSKGLPARARRSQSCPNTPHILKQITVPLTFNLPAYNRDKAADSSCAFFVQQSSWCDSAAALGAMQRQGLAFAIAQHLAEQFPEMQNNHTVTWCFNNVHRRFECRERLLSLIPPSHISQALLFHFPHGAQ